MRPGNRQFCLGGAALGFTLIELIVVLAVVALLITLAMPRYLQSVERAKEAVLAENLQTMRRVIDQFYGDTGRYPESLEELVERKYLRAVPIDPIMERPDTWVLIAPLDDAKGRVYDVKSSAAGSTADGVPFDEL
jgi:general secretion pathway protein G